jgi:hypothetical protein
MARGPPRTNYAYLERPAGLPGARCGARLLRGTAVRPTRRAIVPKSRVRAKAVYTPPPKSAKAKVSPRWLAPTMVGCLLLGLAWIALFYVTEGSTPVQQPIGDWNLVLGFGFIIGALMLATRWR